MMCVICGGRADPVVGGRPKCKPCTLLSIFGGLLMILLGVIYMAHGAWSLR